MKAIQTKYLPGTNNKGSRIKAWTEGGNQITIGYPHELSGQAVHEKAAKALMDKLGWYHQIVGGGFLTAVLENNLCQAFGRADSDNAENLRNIVAYVYNRVPSVAWGSRAKIDQWLLQFEKAA